jgi:hypothetical protein
VATWPASGIDLQRQQESGHLLTIVLSIGLPV